MEKSQTAILKFRLIYSTVRLHLLPVVFNKFNCSASHQKITQKQQTRDMHIKGQDDCLGTGILTEARNYDKEKKKI